MDSVTMDSVTMDSVTIRTLNGNTMDLNIDDKTTVKNLKFMIKNRLGLSDNVYKLEYGNCFLKDDMKIINILDGVDVHSTINMKMSISGLL